MHLMNLTPFLRFSAALGFAHRGSGFNREYYGRDFATDRQLLLHGIPPILAIKSLLQR